MFILFQILYTNSQIKFPIPDIEKLKTLQKSKISEQHHLYRTKHLLIFPFGKFYNDKYL